MEEGNEDINDDFLFSNSESHAIKNVNKLFTDEFIVKGRIKGISHQGSLTKTVDFIILEGSHKEALDYLPFDAEYSFPSLCPFLLYELRVAMAPGCSIFTNKEVLACRKLYSKSGIPKDFLLNIIPEEKWNEIKHLPSFFKRPEDLKSIKASQIVKRGIKDAFKAYFKPLIFYKLLRYFNESFLYMLTEQQMLMMYSYLKKRPFTACFRDSFSRLFNALTGLTHRVSKKPVKYQDWVLDSEATAKYAIEKWRDLISESESMKFDPACPLFSVYTTVLFCRDNIKEMTEKQIALLKRSVFGYMAFERDRMVKKMTMMRSDKILSEMVKFYADYGVLCSLEGNVIYSPHDQLNDMELINILYTSADELSIVDSDSNMDGMYDYIIDIYEEYSDERDRVLAIFVPHVSNVLYFIGKIERGVYFEREKPKRGRKRKSKIRLGEENNAKKSTENIYPIYYLQQWELLVHESNYIPPDDIIVFNAQEFDSASLSRLFAYQKSGAKKAKKLTIIGNTKMWCLGSNTLFNTICRYSNVSYIKPPRPQCDTFSIFNAKGMRKKCDVYENDDLFSESLVEWLKNNGVKWRSKIMMFSNEVLMNKLSMVTSNHILRLGLPNILYVDGLVRAEPMGLFGILKRAHLVNDKCQISDALDIFTAIFPQMHRYLLKVEDYYTKSHFMIDTKFQRCSAPSFGLVRECMSIPYEYVIFIADETTTRQDLRKALELTRGTFMIYYRKGVDIERVFGNQAIFPRTLTEYNVSKYAKSLKILTHKTNDEWLSATSLEERRY